MVDRDNRQRRVYLDGHGRLVKGRVDAVDGYRVVRVGGIAANVAYER